MHAKYECSIINTSEDMSQVKVFVTEGLTDRRTDGRMSFNVPRFRESPRKRGTIMHIVTVITLFHLTIIIYLLVHMSVVHVLSPVHMR